MAYSVTLLRDRRLYYKLNTDLVQLPEKDQTAILRELAKNDLFYLLVYILGREDADTDFVFEKCRMVQAEPNGHLDIWAREHYKSTIITFALSIIDILNNPEITICIFSYSRPIAKQFLRQIKREFESNQLLKQLFPDILWDDPAREAPKWSEDDGLIVRRKGNPKESTLEAWGLIDGQPTSKHFDVLMYDDTVVKKSVTEGMIPKTTEEWQHSLNLGRVGGIRRYAGTIYSRYDTYSVMRERGIPMRWFPATVDGTFEGEPVFWSRETLAEKRREMGSDTFATQILLKPEGAGGTYFDENDVRYYPRQENGGPARWRFMNRCLLVDPASEKKKHSDWTSMLVLGFTGAKQIYVIDWIRDRLNLTQRIKKAIELHRRWDLAFCEVGWERYGKDADIEALETEMTRISYQFSVTRLGGPMPKPDRIKRLQPYYERHQIWLPDTMPYVDYENKTVDLTDRFVKHELGPWTPDGTGTKWDDDLDNMSRMFDLFKSGLPWPDAISHATGIDAIGVYDEMDGFGGRPVGVDALDNYDIYGSA